MLQKLLKVKFTVKFYVIGGTDTRASDSYNFDLSQRRANAVKNYLVSKGVNPDILITEGRGEKTLNIQNVTLLVSVQNGKTKPTEEFISKRLNNFNLSI